MIKAVVFDLDDTLYPEIEYVKSGFKSVAKELSKLIDDDENDIFVEIVNLFQQDKKKVFNRFLKKYGLDSKKNIEILVHVYREHYPNITLSEEVSQLLKRLKDNGYKLGIITDGYKEVQRKKIDALKLWDIFDCIIITDELGIEFWKPHPKPYEMIMKNLNVKPNEMVYIGDNPGKDFHVRKQLPIITIHLETNKGFYSRLSYKDSIQPSYTIQRLCDIEKILTSINIYGNRI